MNNVCTFCILKYSLILGIQKIALNAFNLYNFKPQVYKEYSKFRLVTNLNAILFIYNIIYIYIYIYI